ncbi:MAG TPA: cytochrome P450 [Alphaproteobacteria bacterium]|nr:cytochrome P450 [Alphaproteobacteria bacterium]
MDDARSFDERGFPPHIVPPSRPLSLFETIRAAKTNVLEIIPGLAYRQPIVSGRFGVRWHMVQDPGGLRRIFLDNVDNYPKSEVMLRMLRPAVGDSLFTSEGEAWRWQRRAVAPVFAQRNVVALSPMMTATAARAIERLDHCGGIAEMTSEMLSATFDVICEVALSGREHFDAAAYGEAITRYFETIGKASILDFLRVPEWMPRPGEILGRGAVKTMHGMVAAAIEARRRETAGRAQTKADDLLDYMLKAEDPETGRRMTPTDLLHNMQFFIVAGHETTALSLAWSLLLLAWRPEIQERARAEARAAIGDGPAEADQLASASYVRQIIEESMRLYPPVGMLSRNVREADELCGRAIEPGEAIFLPIYALHRHQMWWERPNDFDPDNFAPDATKGRDRYLYLPFGAGPRACVGANFAMMQAQIILTTLLARFRFRPGPDPIPIPVMTMTLRPDTGVRLIVERVR